MKAFWVYVVLQDFLFYQMKLSDSESFRIDPGLSMEIQEGGVWGEVIDEFFSEFHTDLLRYIGLGYSRIDIFSRPWRSLINGVHYSYNLPYPALISLDRDGRSVLMLRSSLFYPFKSDLTHLQYNEGARLWAKLFLGSALLRSMGISESRLAIVTLLYILENFSPDELRSMFTYMTEGSLHRWLNFEDRGRIDFEILYVKNIVNTKMEVNHSALYQHIDLILNLILDSYDDLRESARYRLFKRFE
jgi:hypothetical protein